MTGAVGQPAPTRVRSKFPLTLRQDEVTFHVPTTLPPQAETLGQAPPAPGPAPAPGFPTGPALPELPPAPKAPPLLAVPAEPAAPSELVLHAPQVSPNATNNTNAALWIFIDECLSQHTGWQALKPPE